jgi:hypothetical protein
MVPPQKDAIRGEAEGIRFRIGRKILITISGHCISAFLQLEFEALRS